MNFFKSVFAEEPTPPDSPESPPESPTSDPQTHNPTSWSFGGLIKTLATKSESMIETYRKDFEELGSGLRKETAVIREAASRAVRDLPASLELGTSVAQESLENVGQAIDDIGTTVAKVISHGRDSILTPGHDDEPGSSSDNKYYDYYSDSKRQPLNLKRYSRFDMQVGALQCDLNTYCSDPEDKVEYEDWRLKYFALEEKKQEIDNLFSEIRVVKEIYDNVVPSRVDSESFWCRYFYKLHKLKHAEEARSLLVQKAISGEEEELSWDFDGGDDDDDKEDDKSNNKSLPEGESSGNVNPEKNNDTGNSNLSDEEKIENLSGTLSGFDKSEGKAVAMEFKGDNGDSCKDSDVSVVSSQSLLPEEEDLGWDEIEDIDYRKGEATGSATNTSRLDLRKRLSAATAEEEEDLSWDIEDEGDERGKP